MITGCVADIVAAYLSNHSMAPEEVPSFMRLVQKSLHGIKSGKTSSLLSPSAPAVPIEESIQPDYIICLEDGKQLKMLKRHLMSSYKMTPEQYRERWDLPATYPMVAPNYAKRPQAIAKGIGLGSHRRKQEKLAA
jgi:predicted transcriptional regulator